MLRQLCGAVLAAVCGVVLTASSLHAATIVSVENDGSIPLANDAGFGGSFTLQGDIGSVPSSGDYDFFRFAGVAAGSTFTAAVFSNFDPVIGLYNAAGTRLFANDDAFGAGGSANLLDSYLNVVLATAGDYYLLIRGFGSGFPADPFDPNSGAGVGSIGSYRIEVTLSPATTGVPEPATLLLLGIGACGAGLRRRVQARSTWRA